MVVIICRENRYSYIMYVFVVKNMQKCIESEEIEILLTNFLKVDRNCSCPKIREYLNQVIKTMYSESSNVLRTTVTYSDKTDVNYQIFIRIIKPWLQLVDRVVSFWIIVKER